MKSASFFLFSVFLHSAVVIAYPFSLAVGPVQRFIPVTILSFGEGGGDSGSGPSAARSIFPAKSAKTSTPTTRSVPKNPLKTATPLVKKQQRSIPPAPKAAKTSVASIAVVAENSIPRFPAIESEENNQAATDPITGGEQGGGITVSRLDSFAHGTGSESGMGASRRGSGSGNTDGEGAGSLAAQLTPVGFSHAPPPDYPASARADGKEGRVLLRVLVDEEGKSKIVEINDSSGSRVLDQAAAEAIKRWRFLPARYGGTAMASWVKIPVDFRLTETKE